jgi:hypothetical protein
VFIIEDNFEEMLSIAGTIASTTSFAPVGYVPQPPLQLLREIF